MAWLRPQLLTLFLCMPLVACSGPASSPGDASACTATLPASDDCATAAPSYASVVASIVDKRCLSCHFAGNSNSSVVLETQTELNRQRGLVETQVYRCEMPPSDGDPLSTSDRQTLLKWLVCGAPNN